MKLPTTNRRVICSIPSPFHGRSVVLWNQAMTMANLFSVLVYTTTWMVIRKFGGTLNWRFELFILQLEHHWILVVSFDQSALWCRLMWPDGQLPHCCSIYSLLSKWEVVAKQWYSKDCLTEGARFSLHYVAGIAVNSGVAFKAIVYYRTRLECVQCLWEWGQLFQCWIPKRVPKRVEDQNFNSFTNNNGRHFGYVARDERNEPN